MFSLCYQFEFSVILPFFFLTLFCNFRHLLVRGRYCLCRRGKGVSYFFCDNLLHCHVPTQSWTSMWHQQTYLYVIRACVKGSLLWKNDTWNLSPLWVWLFLTKTRRPVKPLVEIFCIESCRLFGDGFTENFTVPEYIRSYEEIDKFI